MTDQPTKPVDLDAQMLGGCSAFTVCSLLSYFLGVWPFFFFKPLYVMGPMTLAIGFGVGSSIVFCMVAGRKAHMAGGFGCLAGTAALGIFFYLLTEQTVPLIAEADRVESQIPREMNFLVPLGWFVTILTLVILLARKKRA